MSILVDKNTRVWTQGITGSTGQFHTRACKRYGTAMVAGVTPGKGGGSRANIGKAVEGSLKMMELLGSASPDQRRLLAQVSKRIDVGFRTEQATLA